MNTQEFIEEFDRYVIGNYKREPIVIVRGSGSRMWDLDGKEYLDMFPGWAVSGLGHCHPKVVEAIKKQAEQLIHIDNTFYNVPQGKLAKMLSERSFGGKCFFCNSGAEAVEAAIKLARLFGGEGRYKIITMEKSFHGRTFGAMTATGQAKTHNGFSPLVPGFVYVPFNDIEAVKNAIDSETVAVLLEPVQGEGGINIADEDYIRELRNICDEYELLLIFDEVQTGMGRTGKWFAYQHYGVVPDIMTLAKALGGGVSIGAIVAQPEIAEYLKPGTHASTFGGNPLACSAAIAVIEAIEEGNLLENATKMGEYLKTKLSELARKHQVIQKIKQIGLMIGIEMSVEATELVKFALKNGLRINCTQQNIIRMLPPITVTADEIDRAVQVLDESLKEFLSNLTETEENING